MNNSNCINNSNNGLAINSLINIPPPLTAQGGGSGGLHSIGGSDAAAAAMIGSNVGLMSSAVGVGYDGAEMNELKKRRYILFGSCFDTFCRWIQ